MSTMPLEKALRVAGRNDLTKLASSGSEAYTFNDKNATVMSYVRAHVEGAPETVKVACEQHAKFWGITSECQEAIEKIASYKPAELQDKDFALVDGEIRKYAAYDGDSTFKAAEAFYQNKERYPLSMRKQAAVQLLARADKHGTYLPDFINTYLHKAAGFGYPTPESLDESLVQRLNLVKKGHDEACGKLSQLVTTVTKKAALRYDGDFVKAAVETLENFDAATGITAKYGSDLSLPEEVIDSQLTTNELQKIAGISDRAVTLVNGSTVDVQGLSKEALAAVDPGLAKMAQDELTAVLPTLPKADADLLVRLI